MRKDYQREKVFASREKVYIGVDAHKDSWHVTALIDGEEVFHGRLPSQYPVFKKLLDRFIGKEIKVAYEAGPCGFWLYDRLTEDSIETIVVPPSLIPYKSYFITLIFRKIGELPPVVSGRFHPYEHTFQAMSRFQPFRHPCKLLKSITVVV